MLYGKIWKIHRTVRAVTLIAEIEALQQVPYTTVAATTVGGQA